MRYLPAGFASVLIACIVMAASEATSRKPLASPVKVDMSALPEWQQLAFTNVQVFAKFITGEDLAIIDPLFGDLPELPEDIKNHLNPSNELYLVTLCRPHTNPGVRILSARASVRVGRSNHEFDIISQGFLVSGQCYSVTKIVEADTLSVDRRQILASTPKIKITRAWMK